MKPNFPMAGKRLVPALLTTALFAASAHAQEAPTPPESRPPAPEASPASPEAPPVSPSAPAAPQAELETRAAKQALEARQAAKAEAAEAYARALEAAEAEQRQALEAVETARKDLARQAEEERRLSRDFQRLARENAEQADQARRMADQERERRREENDRIREELERAHENLRRASREVAQVHREINRTERVLAPAPVVRVSGDRAVIGVILGENDPAGVAVLGLTPDGPAERAGLKPGDTITGMMGEPLTGDGVDGREVIGQAMKDVEAGDELVITVQRDGESRDYVVTAQNRTPFAWHSVSRLSSVPTAPTPPGSPTPPVVIHSIEAPRVDRERLEREIEGIRRDLDQRNVIIAERFGEDMNAVIADDGSYFYEFDFSETGDAALAGANLWFGMPLTRGLKLMELEPGLGDYFATERGVLVLQAKEDNALQLQSGDVILRVHGSEVTRPSDVMRALRDVETGEVVEIAIKRQRKNQTLSVEIPEPSAGFGGLIELIEPRVASNCTFTIDNAWGPTGHSIDMNCTDAPVVVDIAPHEEVPHPD